MVTTSNHEPCADRRHDQLTITTSRVSDRRNQSLTLSLEYLRRVLAKRHYWITSIVLRDNEIIAEMHLSKSQYRQIIAKLAKFKIITAKLENGCSYTRHACRYRLDKSLLISEYGFTFADKPMTPNSDDDTIS